MTTRQKSVNKAAVVPAAKTKAIAKLSKKGRKLAKAKKNKKSSKLNQVPMPCLMEKRQRKSEWQVLALKKMFRELEGPITRAVREEAVSMTGLKWSKIYKWLFDQGDKLPVYKRHSQTCQDFEMIEDGQFRKLIIFETHKVAPGALAKN